MTQEYDEFYPAVSMARDIIRMHRRIKELELEVENLRDYKQMYSDMIQADLKHQEHMMGNMLGLLLTPGVSEALINNGNTEHYSLRGGA